MDFLYYLCSRNNNIKTKTIMKSKHIDYFFMIVCFLLAILGIAYEDDKTTLFGMLGFISAGIHYLADKIDELKK